MGRWRRGSKILSRSDWASRDLTKRRCLTIGDLRNNIRESLLKSLDEFVAWLLGVLSV